jgi:hypothetical protein
MDVTGSLTINPPGGATFHVSITAICQKGLLTFNGNAGQLVTVHLTNVNFPGSLAPRVSLVRANGTTELAGAYFGTSGNLAQVTLPATETYSVKINPTLDAAGANTGSMDVQVTSP